MGDPGSAFIVIAWLTAGLAAVAVAPRNRASLALLVGGSGAAASVVLQPLAPTAPRTVQGEVLVLLPTVGFLVGVLALAAVLMLHPRGVFERRWHAVALLVLVGVAAATLAGLLFAAPRLSLDGSGPGGLSRPNLLAIPALAGLEPAVAVLWTSTLAWPLVGIVVVAARLRARDPERRREALVLLVGIGVFAVIAVVQLVAVAAGLRLPEPGFGLVFQITLGLLPVALLAGIARRTRRLDADLAAANARLGAAEDRVRREIERDLHDGVQQQLVAILTLTQLAQREQARGPDAAGATLQEISGQVSGAIGDLRELVGGIRPPVLADAGVGAALAARLDRLPVDVDLRTDGEERWSDAVESAAYFVGCEAVTNAVKHAPGSRVVVEVVARPAELTIAVTDDGAGIRDGWRRGRGLSGLEDRVRSLGGAFEVGPAPGRGTAVRARFRREPA